MVFSFQIGNVSLIRFLTINSINPWRKLNESYSPSLVLQAAVEPQISKLPLDNILLLRTLAAKNWNS